MATVLHPGVYVLEVPSPARSIESVTTSTTVFVGETERGPTTPIKLTSRTDYTRQFGGYLRQNTATNGFSPTVAYNMDAFFGNGGTTCYVLRAMNGSPGTVASRSQAGPPAVKLNATSPGTWANGTATNGVYAILLPSTDGSSGRFRIVVAFTPLETGLQAIVEDWDRLSDQANDENYVVDVLKRSLFLRWDDATTPAIPGTLDGPAGLTPAQILALAVPAQNTQLTGGTGGNTDAAVPADYQLALLDDITDASLLVLGTQVKSDSSIPALNALGIQYVLTRPLRDMFYIGSLQRHNGNTLATNAVQDAVTEFDSAGLPKSDFAAVYFPWVFVADPVGTGKDPQVAVGPAATIAGIYARTDATIGVWKAPAGVTANLLGVRKLEFNIQDIHQDIMNPKGINALRNQPGAGAVVWGGRTMRPSSEWRYINVRRMAIFLRMSIYNGIQFAVFEGNDEPLWAALRLTIGGFMDSLFRLGAFAGGSASEAYFVKCDAETTTPTDQIAGVVNVLVGFSPLRPAEFVVVKLSQIVRSGA
jgi:phage tail sheath protein FI